MTEKLLDCPWCGPSSEPYTAQWAVWAAKCPGCGAEQIGLTEAEAISRWNTRPQSDLTREGVARVIRQAAETWDASGPFRLHLADAILAMALKET